MCEKRTETSKNVEWKKHNNNNNNTQLKQKKRQQFNSITIIIIIIYCIHKFSKFVTYHSKWQTAAHNKNNNNKQYNTDTNEYKC